MELQKYSVPGKKELKKMQKPIHREPTTISRGKVLP